MEMAGNKIKYHMKFGRILSICLVNLQVVSSDGKKVKRLSPLPEARDPKVLFAPSLSVYLMCCVFASFWILHSLLIWCTIGFHCFG